MKTNIVYAHRKITYLYFYMFYNTKINFAEIRRKYNNNKNFYNSIFVLLLVSAE